MDCCARVSRILKISGTVLIKICRRWSFWYAVDSMHCRSLRCYTGWLFASVRSLMSVCFTDDKFAPPIEGKSSHHWVLPCYSVLQDCYLSDWQTRK